MSKSALYHKIMQAFDGSHVPKMDALIEDFGLNAEQQTRLKTETTIRTHSIRTMAEAMNDPEDEEELYRSLAFTWLELRVAWNCINQMTNYQVMLAGQADPEHLVRGSLMSYFIALVEPMLVMTDLEHLVVLSAEPLEIGRPEGSADDEVQVLHDRSGVVEALYQDAHATASAIEQTESHHQAQAAARSFKTRLESSAKAIRQLRSVSLSAIWPYLQREVVDNINVPQHVRYDLRLEHGNDAQVDYTQISKVRDNLVQMGHSILSQVLSESDNPYHGQHQNSPVLRCHVETSSTHALVVELELEGEHTETARDATRQARTEIAAPKFSAAS